MKTLRNMRQIPSAEEIRQRAAEIRKLWSPDEQRRRTGLPPDAPPRMREFILRHRSMAWEPATCDTRFA